MIPIDLRSDTVTRPGPAMREAIARAEVGDDVLGDDPTVQALQARVAALLGKQAALFTPSGTMANQLDFAAQARPGNQVIVVAQAHVLRYEAGAPAALSGLQLTPVAGVHGALAWPQIEEALHEDDIHCAQPALVCLENTHNRAGCAIVLLAEMDQIAAGARPRGLRPHFDGALLWNAVVATAIAPRRWAQAADSVAVCFSKGLAAPLGSALAGTAEMVAAGRRLRACWSASWAPRGCAW